MLSARSSSRTGHLDFVFPVCLYGLGAFVFFRGQILSNFDQAFGDRGDARFVVFLHEHVYRCLLGHGEFLSPPFFFDQAKTLGYSEVFLLDQFLYTPLRLLGVEPLLALSWVVILLSPIGFTFLYLFLRRLGISATIASLAALIFTFSNNLYLKSGHLQHFAVYYVPVVVYCAAMAVGELHRRPRQAYLMGGFAGALCGLLFSTSYYIAWFFGLALLIFTPVAACNSWSELRDWWRKQPARVLGLGLASGIGFLAALAIFFSIYASVLADGLARSFGEYLYFAPRPYDVVNVGAENLVWSRLIQALHLIDDDHLNNGERWVALTPTVQALLLASMIFAFRPGFWPAEGSLRVHRALVVGSTAVCILLFLLVVSVGRYSVFYILYAIVPGANAIRASYRCMIVANLFAVTAIALTFDRVISFSSAEARQLLPRGGVAALTGLLLLAAIEQVNLAHPAGLSRRLEHQYFSAVAPAPRDCQSFYVAPEQNATEFEVQLDAMMVAMMEHVPTLNGYSGFIPKGWDFYDTKAADYEQHALRWAAKRGITHGLCRLDIKSGTWTLVTRGDN